MPLLSQPRIQAPASVARGEVFRVKAIIGHAMETGLRRDAQGAVIPRHIINRFECRYRGVAAFSATLHEAMAANPYFEFHLRATESGPLDFVWIEDGGQSHTLSHDLVVT